MWQHLSDSVPDNYESCMSIAYADSHGNINANCYGNCDSYGNCNCNVYANGHCYSYGYTYRYGNAYIVTNANAHSTVPMAHNGLLSAGGHG